MSKSLADVGRDPLRKALAELIDWIRYCLMALSILALLLLIGWAKFHKDDAETCNSPCIVKFPKGTQEDEFRIDYQHGGTLRVWVKVSR
jgi:hypothetical protein